MAFSSRAGGARPEFTQRPFKWTDTKAEDGGAKPRGAEARAARPAAVKYDPVVLKAAKADAFSAIAPAAAAAAAVIKTCSQGHTLKDFTTPDADYACDICSKGIDKGSSLWGCRTCEFDVCSKCRSGAGGAAAPAWARAQLDAQKAAAKAAAVPAELEATTPIYEVITQTNTVRAEPVTTAKMKTKKSRGSRLFCAEVTVDGWLKLAKEKGQEGWLLTHFRGLDGTHEAARAVDSDIDLAVPYFQSQGIAMLEVLPKSGVPVFSAPSRTSKKSHIRKCGERVFVRCQNFDGWARLVGEEAWVQRCCPDAGEGFREIFGGCKDLWALSDLWSAVRKAKGNDLSASDIEALREAETGALIMTTLVFDGCAEVGNVDPLMQDGYLTEEQLDNHELRLRQLTYASLLRQSVVEQHQDERNIAQPTDAFKAHLRSLRRAVPQFDYRYAERPVLLALSEQDLTQELYAAVEEFQKELSRISDDSKAGRFHHFKRAGEDKAALMAEAHRRGLNPAQAFEEAQRAHFMAQEAQRRGITLEPGMGSAAVAEALKGLGAEPEKQRKPERKPEAPVIITTKPPAVRASLNYSKFDNIEDSGSEDEAASAQAAAAEQYRVHQQSQLAAEGRLPPEEEEPPAAAPSLLATDEQRKAAKALEAKRRAAKASEEAERQRRAAGGGGTSPVKTSAPASGDRYAPVREAEIRRAPAKTASAPSVALPTRIAAAQAPPRGAPAKSRELNYSKFDKLAESDSEDERIKEAEAAKLKEAQSNYEAVMGRAPVSQDAPPQQPTKSEPVYNLPRGKPRIPGYGKEAPKPAGPPQKTMAYKEGLSGLPMRQDDYDFDSLPPFIYEGNVYKMAPNGVLWDPPNSNPVGIWNPVTKRVEPVAGQMPPGSVPGMLPGQQVSMLCYFGKTYILMPDNSVVDPETQEVVSIFNPDTRQLQPITPVPLADYHDKDMNLPVHTGDGAKMPPPQQNVGLTSRSLPECLDQAQKMFEKGRYEHAAGLLEEALYECRKSKVVDVDCETLILRKRADCWSRVGRYAELQCDVEELLANGCNDLEVQEFKRICEVASQNGLDARNAKTLPVRAAPKKAENTIKCAYCTVPTSKPSMCTRCKNTFYCDGVCQRKHWSVHKEECGKVRVPLPAPELSTPVPEPEDIEGSMEDMD